MSTLSWLEVLLGATVIVGSVAGFIGFKMGHEVADRKQLIRLRDAALEACISNHPAGKNLPRLRVVKQ